MEDNQYVAGVIYRWQEEGGEKEYLVIEYDSGKGTQIKFPGGTNNDRPGETVEETLHRELRDEVGLVLPYGAELIWEKEPMPNPGGGFHRKYAFAAHWDTCAGSLRTVPMNDGGDKLSPPFWMTAKELRKDPKVGGIFYTHKPILEAAEKKLG